MIEYGSGVLERCDGCGRQTIVQAVPDESDPLGWVIDRWECLPCSLGMEVDDD